MVYLVKMNLVGIVELVFMCSFKNKFKNHIEKKNEKKKEPPNER
jgi:hypothetical protein